MHPVCNQQEDRVYWQTLISDSVAVYNWADQYLQHSYSHESSWCLHSLPLLLQQLPLQLLRVFVCVSSFVRTSYIRNICYYYRTIMPFCQYRICNVPMFPNWLRLIYLFVLISIHFVTFYYSRNYVLVSLLLLLWCTSRCRHSMCTFTGQNKLLGQRFTSHMHNLSLTLS